jgi:hypothetical protein
MRRSIVIGTSGVEVHVLLIRNHVGGDVQVVGALLQDLVQNRGNVLKALPVAGPRRPASLHQVVSEQTEITSKYLD